MCDHEAMALLIGNQSRLVLTEVVGAWSRLRAELQKERAQGGLRDKASIAQALEIILESPVLRSFEAMVNTALSFQGLKVGVPLARVSAGPYMSV